MSGHTTTTTTTASTHPPSGPLPAAHATTASASGPSGPPHSDFVYVTGVKGPAVDPEKGPYARRPLKHLIDTEDQMEWSLYIQAIGKISPADRIAGSERDTEAMMEATHTDPVSWFSIGAVHGAAIPWQGDESFRRTASDGETSPGWCVHHTVNFLTWHRVYVALFEVYLFIMPYGASVLILLSANSQRPRKEDRSWLH
jgi:hypothetical protein